jgi:DNA invertase Pin-like site-specific DNA recombinase
MKIKRAAVYARVSTGEQNTELQERSLLEYVNRRGWQVSRCTRFTGTKESRESSPAGLHLTN